MSSIIRKALKLSREDYFKKHLLIINHILPIQMTPKEAEVLAAFMSVKRSVEENNMLDGLDPFGTSGRKMVRTKLGISPGGLGNYLDQLKKKGFILQVEEKLQILPFLIPAKGMQGYQFKLEVDE